MDKLGYIAVPYLFLMFLAFAIQDGIRAAIKRASVTRRPDKRRTQTYAIPLCGPNMDKAIPIPDTGAFKNLTRRGSKGQSLVEVCAMLAVVLALAVGARHVGMHVFEALRDVVTVTHGTN